MNEESPEQTECTFGRICDSRCHCCECNQVQQPVYDEIDEENLCDVEK